MKKIAYFIWLVSAFSIAQVNLEENIIIDESYYTHSKLVSSADIDGDGDMDLITNFAWLENRDGLGDFGLPQPIINNILPTDINSLYTVDIDGDNDIDMLYAYGNQITWAENLNGLGDFAVEQVITTGALGASNVYAGDIDNDGDLDILSSSVNDGKIAWYENTDGEGTFGPEQIITTLASGATSVHSADIDADGDLDVFSTSTTNDEVSWYENTDGQGTFGPRVVIYDDINTQPQLVFSGDIDADGDLDIIVLDQSKVSWYSNLDGIGNFSSQQIISNDHGFLKTMQVVDLDNDGDLDIVSGDLQELGWSENTDGQGTFGSKQLIQNKKTEAVSVSDMDSDGDMDVLINGMIWYSNIDGLGTFDEGKNEIFSASGTVSLESGDIDGDGDLDVLASNVGDDSITWYENLDGNGTFGDQQFIGGPIASSSQLPSSVFSADINGDGHLDVLYTIKGTGDFVAWHENLDGEGTFGPRIILGVPGNLSQAIPCDMDGDGDFDILYNGDLGWLENLDGMGSFSSTPNVITTNGKHNFFPVDLDGDGDLDVVHSNNDEAIWFENIDGQGNFGPQQNITTNAFQLNLPEAHDVDGDGDLDIIISDYDKLAWVENTDGEGAFGPEHTIFYEFNAHHTGQLGIDLDTDGDIDIIKKTFFDEVIWFENLDGQGAFSSGELLNNDRISIMKASDIDGDGDLDLLSTNGSDKTSWYENLGAVTNQINGIVSYDTTGNTCASGSFPLANFLVSTNNGTDEISTFTANNGSYKTFSIEEGQHVTSVIGLPTFLSSSPNTATTSFAGIGNTDTLDFCISTNQTINDISISVYPSVNNPRPGFDTHYRIVYRNVGTTQLSGDVILEFDDSKLNFLNANQTVDSQTSNTLTFNYSNLNPFETRTIDLEFNVFPPPTTNIDDVLSFVATINPITGDNIEEDNVFTFNQTVIGSYDPNDIRVLEGDEILLEDKDKYLHYIIRFQNTGTADAINIRVDNLLDSKLDWDTIQLESLSHDGRVEIRNGNQVSFIFNGIYLPDSTTDEPNSHGFIAYKIKPKSDVALGDIMSNTADIFFDFNPAIVTNTATTEIVNTLSVNQNNISNFLIHPVPVEKILNIVSSTSINTIEVFNSIGQLVLSASNTNLIDVSILNSGIYLVKIKDDNDNSEIKKIIKD